MSKAVLDKLREERDEARSAAVALAESDNFNPEDEVYKGLKTRAESLDARVSELASLFEARKNSDAIDGRLAKSSEGRSDRSPVTTQSRESIGEMFVRSEAFQEYAGSPRGRMPRFEMESRALPTGLTDLVAAGFNPTPFRENVQPPQAPTPLLDNISRVQVSNNAVEFVQWIKVAGAAAVVAEKGAKPSGEWAPQVTADSLDNIAEYTQLTRQLIEDEGAVRDLINGELVNDIRRAEEVATATAIAAAVTAGDIPTYTQAGDGSLGYTSAELLEAIRAGIGTVQSSGYVPNAMLLNPADWAALDNVVMSSTLNGPVVRQNFWGLTPIASTAQAAGSVIVGDFRTGVRQYFRSNIALYVTDSHADTFLSNVFTLLAERRALSAVIRPNALVNVTVDATGV